MNDVVSGKENILEYMRGKYHVHSWKTVKRWKKNGMPIRYLLNNAPFIVPEEIILWAVKRDDLVKQNKP